MTWFIRSFFCLICAGLFYLFLVVVVATASGVFVGQVDDWKRKGGPGQLERVRCFVVFCLLAFCTDFVFLPLSSSWRGPTIE